MKHIGEYRVESFPSSRIATFDIVPPAEWTPYQSANRTRCFVTEARKMIAEKKKQKQNVSFNPWLIKCISKAVEECKDIHGIRKEKRNIVIFFWEKLN